MRVHRAETGIVYSVDVTPQFTVENLKEALASISRVAPADQILLCNYTKLEKNQTLAHYGLPSDDKPVFLFNRKSLEADSPAPEEVVLPLVELKNFLSAPNPMPSNQSLQDQSPIMITLMKYDTQFQNDCNTAGAMKKVVDARIDICKSCSSEQDTQARGLEVAKANLNDQHKSILEVYVGFKSYYKECFQRHQKLLESFEDDMQKLKETRLHSSLVRSNMTTLMDFVPEAKLRKWAEECTHEHRQLASLVADLDKQMNTLSEGVEYENKKSADVDFNSLQTQLKKATEISMEIDSRLKSFSDDCLNIKRRVEQAKQTNSFQSLFSMLDELQNTQENHARYLSKMNEQDQAMKNIMSFCASSKTKLSRCVHERLRTISILESKIRETANKIIVYHEACARQKTAFQQLLYVQSMPRAYHASLDEVSRRRKFRKYIVSMNGKFLETLSKLREEEIQKRQNFLNMFGRYVPRDLIPGLNQPLPPFDIGIPTFDNLLPQMDTDETSVEEEDFSIMLSEEKRSRMTELEKENERLIKQLKQVKGDLTANSSNSNSSLNANNSNNNNNSSTNNSNNPHIAMENSNSNKTNNNSFYNASTSSKSNAAIGSSYTAIDMNELLQLRADLASSQESVNDYKKRISSLEQKLSETYSQMEKMESTAKLFKERYARLEAEQEQIRTDTKLAKATERRLVEIQKELETMQKKKIELEAMLKERTDQLAVCKTEKETFEKQRNTSQRESLQSGWTVERDQLQQERDHLQKARDQLVRENEETQQERDELQQHYSELQQQHSQLLQDWDDLRRESDQLRQQYDQILNENEQIQQQLSVCEGELRNHQLLHEQDQHRLEEVEAKLAANLAEIQGLRGALLEKLHLIDKLSAQPSEQQQQQQQQHSSSTNEELRTQLDEKSSELLCSSENITELRKQLQTIQAQFDSLEKKSNALQEENRTLRESIDSLNGKVKELTFSLSLSEKEINRFKQNLESQSKLLQKKEDELKGMSNLQEKYVNAVKLLENKHKLLSDLQNEQKFFREEIKRLQERISNDENVLTASDEKFMHLFEELKTIEQSFPPLRELFGNAESLSKNNNNDFPEKTENPKSDESLIEATLSRIRHNLNSLVEYLKSSLEESTKLSRERDDAIGCRKALEIAMEHDKVHREDLNVRRISISSFKADDYALFLPDENGVYEAFNINCPNYFLSGDSLQALSNSEKRNPISGQIVEIEEHNSTMTDNPFNVPIGTIYHVVTICPEQQVITQ